MAQDSGHRQDARCWARATQRNRRPWSWQEVDLIAATRFEPRSVKYHHTAWFQEPTRPFLKVNMSSVFCNLNHNAS